MTREEIIREIAAKSELNSEIVERDFGSLRIETLTNMLKLICRANAIGQYYGYCCGIYTVPIPDYPE